MEHYLVIKSILRVIKFFKMIIFKFKTIVEQKTKLSDDCGIVFTFYRLESSSITKIYIIFELIEKIKYY